MAVDGVSEAVETEHRREIGGDGYRFGVTNPRLSMGFVKFGDGRRLKRAEDWVWRSFIFLLLRERDTMDGRTLV